MFKANLVEKESDEYRIILDRIDVLLQSVGLQVRELANGYYSNRIVMLRSRKEYIEKELASLTHELTEAAARRMKK